MPQTRAHSKFMLPSKNYVLLWVKMYVFFFKLISSSNVSLFQIIINFLYICKSYDSETDWHRWTERFNNPIYLFNPICMPLMD